MNYAFTSGKILNGTKDMQIQTPDMVRAVCDKAHADGYMVSAHVESPEGVRVALENGVDSIEKGKYADMIDTSGNPLDDPRVLRNLEMVITKGNIIDHPKIKKRKNVDAELDKFL